MVCIYCGSKTAVTNSRHHKTANEVWRRRQCEHCHGIFTSYESASLDKSIVVQYDATTLVPFVRDALFVSVFESCKHQTNAIENASALVQTIIRILIQKAHNGVVPRNTIVAITYEVLARFDTAAATIYSAYHLKNE